MKNNPKYILHVAFGTLLLVIWLIAVLITHTHLQKAQVAINASITPLLEEAVQKNVKERTKDTYMASIYQHSQQTGRAQRRTFQSADTTFTYESKSVDAATGLFQTQQFLLLLTDCLKSNEIQSVFDSLLLSRQIQAHTAIRIVASGYLKQLDCHSGDTASTNIDNRLNYEMDNGLGRLKYTAYLDYSFATLWNQTSKEAIYWSMLLTALLIIGFAKYVLKPKEKKEKALLDEKPKAVKVIKRKPIDTNSTIEIKKMLKTQGENVLYQGEKMILQPQPLSILRFFLETEELRISKEELKKNVWNNTKSTGSNMTSAIKRLNDAFEQRKYPFIVITDTENKSYYCLLANPACFSD